MKIESGSPGNLSFGEGGDLGLGTEITKQGGKVTLLVGESDLVNISQVQNSLQLNINDAQRVMLSPEESKNLEIRGDKSQVTVDPKVTIPIKGMPLATLQLDTGRRGPAFAASRQNETSFTASITQRLLIFDLKNQMGSTESSTPARLMESDKSAAPEANAPEIDRMGQTSPPVLSQSETPPNLSLLSAQEKGTLVYALSETIMEAPNSAMDRAGVNRILQSVQSPEEFKAILGEGDPALLQQSMMQGVSNPRTDSILADFNITAGALRFPELAIDPVQAKIGSDALAAGFSPRQIISARQEIGQSQSANGEFPEEAILRFSENPVLMTATTSEEKAGMIKTLLNQESRGLDVAKERSIVSILEFASNKAEFDFIVDSNGGKKIVSGMLDPITIGRFNGLAGAYERLPLATVRDQAIETFGALAFPETVEKALPGTFPSGDLSQFVAGIFAGMERQIGTLDRRSFVVSILENTIRESQGLPLFDPIDLRKQAESILREGPPASWASALDHLRDQFGLSEYVMTEIATQPLAQIFRGAASDLSAHIDQNLFVLGDRIRKVITTNGINSSAAEVIRSELGEFQSRIPASQIKNLQDTSNILGPIFPLPPKSVGTIFAKILPGSDLTQQAIQTLKMGDTTQILDGLSRIPAPLLSQVANYTRQTLALPTALPNLMRGLESLRGMDSADMPVPLRIYVEKGISFVQNIANGSHAEALNVIARSLQGSADPPLRRVADMAHEGAVFFSDLVSGEFQNVLSKFTAELRNFVTHPAVLATNQLVVGMETSVPPLSETDIREGFKSIREAADEFAGCEPFRRALETVRMSGDFVGALYRGNFVRMLAPLNSRLGNSPAVLHLIQSGLHLTTLSGSFLRTIIHRDFERPIAQALRKNPSNKGFKEAEEIFSQAAQSFTPIANVEYMDALWQYHKQLDHLRDEVFLKNTIEEFKNRK